MFNPPSRPPRSATLVPREELVNLKRWQSTEFTVPGAAKSAPTLAPGNQQAVAASSDDAAAHAARLAEERQQAQAEGYTEGLRAGREQGLQEGHTQGHAEGYAAGHEQGLQEGRASARAEADAVRAVLRECKTAVAGLHEAVGPALLQLARDIAQQVVRSELKLQPELIVDVVRELLETETIAQTPATVYLHPDDAALVAHHVGEALAEDGWRIAHDATLSRGGCRIRSAYGDLDATLQTRWREICAAAGGDTPWPD